MAYIKVENLKYRYPNTTKLALDGLDFEIEKGSFVGVIGENGAGKSTLCQAFNGLVPGFFKGAYGGKVLIEDTEVAKTTVSKLCQKVGLVFQNPFNQLSGAKETVFEEIAFGLQNFGVPKEEMISRVDEVMELLDIAAYRDRNPFDLSGGQMQRVALAGILAMKPEVIVLDEPTSYLDIKYKLEFLSILQRLKRQKNLTVIMSLHELDMAKRVSDHILCIDGRYVDRYGTPEDVFTDQYVSGLFGITAGSFDETGEDLELEKPDGRARIFVIAGGGLGRKSFRSLQRKGIPFATGIIYENDLDYPAAKALSAEIVSARSFEPVDDALIEKAKELIDACEGVICDRTEFGTYEQFNSRLYEYAVSTGKIIKIPFLEEQLAQL